jgi:hypothetical protein
MGAMFEDDPVHLSVSWGYDVTVDLYVSTHDWSKIIEGRDVTIREVATITKASSFGIIGIFPVGRMANSS